MSSKIFEYAIKRGDKSYGIRSLELLKNLAAERKIVPQDNIYYYNENKWIKAGQISALANVFAFQTDGYNLNKITMTADMTVPEISRSQVKKHLSPTSPPKTVREKNLPRKPSSPVINRQRTGDNKFDVKSLFEDYNEEPLDKDTKSDMIYKKISSTQMQAATGPETITEINKKTTEPKQFSTLVYVVAIVALLIFGTGAFMLGTYLAEDNDFYARLEASQTGDNTLPIRDIAN